MSIASHGRRLDALAPTERQRTLGELLEDSAEEKAVKALCAFARALVAAVPPLRCEPSIQTARRAQMPPAAPPPPPKPERLDPREVVTFEEAMRQPWVGLEPIEPSVPPSEQPPQLPRPKGWIDPWGGGGFLFPSYATDEPE
jgi:hypothetical protein